MGRNPMSHPLGVDMCSHGVNWMQDCEQCRVQPNIMHRTVLWGCMLGTVLAGVIVLYLISRI